MGHDVIDELQAIDGAGIGEPSFFQSLSSGLATVQLLYIVENIDFSEVEKAKNEVKKFHEVFRVFLVPQFEKIEAEKSPNNLLMGASGFLYALLLLDKRLERVDDETMEVYIKDIKFFISETIKKMQPKIVKKRQKPMQETTFVKQQKTVQ